MVPPNTDPTRSGPEREAPDSSRDSSRPSREVTANGYRLRGTSAIVRREDIGITFSAESFQEQQIANHLEIVRRNARRYADQVERDAQYQGVSLLGTIHDSTELGNIPKTDPLINGWLDLRTANELVGDTGTYKSFMLIGHACSIATGLPWLDHEVAIDPAPAILVIGEGAGGLEDRINAWVEENLWDEQVKEKVRIARARGARMPRVPRIPYGMLTIMRLPIDINNQVFWDALTEFAVSAGARFVGLDTWSSLAPSADEIEDAAQMDRWLTELALAIDGTTELAVHTPLSDPRRSRGGSQLEDNADGIIVAYKDGNSDDAPVCIWRKKDKDGPAGKRMWVTLKPVGNSCVLDIVEKPESASSNGKHRWRTDEYKTAIIEWINSNEPSSENKITGQVWAQNREKGAARDGVRLAFEAMKGDEISDVQGEESYVDKKGRNITRGTTNWVTSTPGNPQL
jgi:hypothetical protein